MTRARYALLAAATLALLAGCEREARRFEQPREKATMSVGVRQSEIQPGQPAGPPPAPPKEYESNAFALAEGQRLFGWYNCNGCHANGGGDKGPALMDDVWIYGSSAQNIYETIKQGRPNGMPSFGGHIPDDQIWKLAVYVRSMSGLVREDVAPGRKDALQAKEPENRQDITSPPVNAATPPASQQSR